MGRNAALPRLTGAAKPPRPETVIVEVEAEPESELDVALIGAKALVTLKHDTEGNTMRVRVLRECNVWVEGDTPTVNATYGDKLIENGLAEPFPAKRIAPKGRTAKPD